MSTITNTKHTPGPWEQGTESDAVGSPHIIYDERHGIIICEMKSRLHAAANARRIVECVNGCEGINPAAVPDLLEACIMAVASDSFIRLNSAAQYAINAAIAKAIEAK